MLICKRLLALGALIAVVPGCEVNDVIFPSDSLRFVRCAEVAQAAERSEALREGEPLELTVGRGHRLLVPAGAAPAGTRFWIRQLASDSVKVAVEVEDGARNRFDPPVQLSLNYAGCSLPGASAAQLRIFRLLPNGEFEDVGGVADETGLPVITTELDHLSEYAIAVPQ